MLTLPPQGTQTSVKSHESSKSGEGSKRQTPKVQEDLFYVQPLAKDTPATASPVEDSGSGEMSAPNATQLRALRFSSPLEGVRHKEGTETQQIKSSLKKGKAPGRGDKKDASKEAKAELPKVSEAAVKVIVNPVRLHYWLISRSSGLTMICFP